MKNMKLFSSVISLCCVRLDIALGPVA